MYGVPVPGSAAAPRARSVAAAPRQLQRSRPVLCDLELLGLDGLLGLQAKLVRCLHRLQRTRWLWLTGRPARFSSCVRFCDTCACIPHRGVQAVERVLPAFACVPVPCGRR